MNCYNCGAPVTANRCGYCGTIHADFSKYILPSMDPKIKKHSADCGGDPMLLVDRDPVSFDRLFQYTCKKCKKRTKIYHVDSIDPNCLINTLRLAFEDFDNGVFEA